MSTDDFARLTEEYIFMEDEPARSDIIFVPGNGFPHMAERAAQLWKEGFAPLILPSGRYSIKAGRFAGVQGDDVKYAGPYETEWDFLQDVLRRNGVPEDHILKENEATYTWQNAQLSRQVCDRKGLSIKKALLCCRDIHSRRAWLYYSLAFPEARIRVIPVSVGNTCRHNWRSSEEGIQEVMAEAQRIITQFSLYMNRNDG